MFIQAWKFLLWIARVGLGHICFFFLSQCLPGDFIHKGESSESAPGPQHGEGPGAKEIPFFM